LFIIEYIEIYLLKQSSG